MTDNLADATDADPTDTEPADRELPEQVRIRREKLDRIRASGVDPYPAGYPRTTSLAELRARYPELPPGQPRRATIVGITGRVVLNRITGKLIFATLQEGGERLQVMLTADATGPEALAAWKADVDLGDHVGVTG